MSFVRPLARRRTAGVACVTLAFAGIATAGAVSASADPIVDVQIPCEVAPTSYTVPSAQDIFLEFVP